MIKWQKLVIFFFSSVLGYSSNTQRELLKWQKVEVKSSHLQAIIPDIVHRKQETGHDLSAFKDSRWYIQMQWVSGFKIIIWTSVMVNLLCNYYCFIFTKLGIDCFHGIRFMTTRFFNKRQNPAHASQDWFWGREKEKKKKCWAIYFVSFVRSPCTECVRRDANMMDHSRAGGHQDITLHFSFL